MNKKLKLITKRRSFVIYQGCHNVHPQHLSVNVKRMSSEERLVFPYMFFNGHPSGWDVEIKPVVIPLKKSDSYMHMCICVFSMPFEKCM